MPKEALPHLFPQVLEGWRALDQVGLGRTCVLCVLEYKCIAGTDLHLSTAVVLSIILQNL